VDQGLRQTAIENCSSPESTDFERTEFKRNASEVLRLQLLQTGISPEFGRCFSYSFERDSMPTNTANHLALRIIDAADFEPEQWTRSLDADTVKSAEEIVNDIRRGGEPAIRAYAEKFGERMAEQPLLIGPEKMEEAAKRIDPSDIELLRRVAHRIGDFADSQLECLAELSTPVPGGSAGHTIEPIRRVGCYAPAGRFALPSTILMTVVPALSAGCESIILATPNPSDLMLATAAIAGASRVLAIGGAHAIATLAYGFDDFERCDLIVGPGNRWVTAAKKIVSGDCGIDMLAGPSELVIVADETANPKTVAADILAQAEHDSDARPFLVTISKPFAQRVGEAIEVQLKDLPSADTAKQSLRNGAAIIVDSLEQTIEIVNELAPEHLELHCENASQLAEEIAHAGCIFIGEHSAEVFGDYGIGPNHTLPTGGTSRWSAGLNVFTYLRVRTWLKLDAPPAELVADTARLAELEGLIGHQRAALRRS
jgi:phosphoribosyl-ATP pyrophosphohydrolase/phosphoribosyl-AMP cyclohydrolase/histidinol dehydrogenase